MTQTKPFEKLNIFTLPLKVKEGYRPELNDSIPVSYKNLIQSCWAQHSYNRPTFDDILESFNNDHGFITNDVNENEFQNYIKYINQQEITFDSSKRINIMQSNIFNIKIFENIKNYPLRDFLNLDDECKLFVEDAESDTEKLFQIGQILIEGQGRFYQDVEIGMKYLQKSIEIGSIQSSIYLCEMYLKGNIIPKDIQEAKKILEKYLKKDESIYYLLLGKIYKKEKNFNEALNCFNKSLNLGNSEAMYEFGQIHFKGKCSNSDKEIGINYIKKAVENGCLQAMYKYGLILKSEKETKEEGIKLIKLAADKGHTDACFCYLTILENDDDVQCEKDELFKYLKKTAYKGHVEGMFQYGNYLDNINESEKKDDECLLFLKKASDKGQIEAMFKYGVLISNQNRLNSISKESLKFIRISAKSGLPIAMTEYAKLILTSNADGLSKEEGINYYKMAIDKGCISAINSYANNLLEGTYIPMNKEEAIKYYKLGIEKGDSNSMLNYATALKSGNGVPVDLEEAKKYYIMAAKKRKQNGIGKLCIHII